jgi:hypothetical protein
LAVQAANPTLVQLLLSLPQGDLGAFVNMKVGIGVLWAVDMRRMYTQRGVWDMVWQDMDAV